MTGITSKSDAKIVMILGGIFAAIGAFIICMALYTLGCYISTLFWTEVPAQILEARSVIKTVSGSDGVSRSHILTARYEYFYKGKKYEETKIYRGSFYSGIAEQLKSYEKSGIPFRCFVNPSDPRETLLYRNLLLKEMSFILIFGLIFGGAGLKVILFSLKESKRFDYDSPHW